MSKEISRRKFLTLGAVGASALVISEITRQSIFKSEKKKILTVTNSPTSTLTPDSAKTQEPTPTSTPKPPEKPILSPEMLQLQDKLRLEIENYEGQTAIAVTDVLTGESIHVNGNRPQLPGCVANLACALTAVSELSKNKALFTKEEIENNLTVMVRHSNPSAGLKVVESIGGGNLEKGVNKINECMKEWGMYKSSYDHPPAFDTTFSAHGESNWIVPNEMNSVLTNICKRQLFLTKDFDWNIYALWVMSNNKAGLNFMIPGQIPESDAKVYHKVGWVPGKPNTINDSGVVSANDKRFLYAITFMHQNLNNSSTENSLFYGPGSFGSKLSKITYDTFSQKYPIIN